MIEIIAMILQILLIGLSIAIILHKNNTTLVILIASFGLVAATLYILNQAPDVAIAEVAVSSAIIPLIYVISISRQRQFIVINAIDQHLEGIDEKREELMKLLETFVNDNGLKLNMITDMDEIYEEHVAVSNVDLMIFYNEKMKKFDMVGKSTSILIKKLHDLTKDHPSINVFTIEEGESYD